MKKYSKYFYKDSHGQMRMTYEGWKEYNRKNRGTIAGKVMTTPEGTTIRVADTHKGKTPSAFRVFMDSIGAYKVTRVSGSLVILVIYGASMLILQQEKLQDMMLQELLSMTILLQVISRVI